MLPIVVTYALPAGNATSLSATQAATSLLVGLATTVIPGPQRRIVITSAGNDSALLFKIIGLNQANNTISELLAGANATFAQSNLDYESIISILPQTLTGSIGTTASTVSVGVNGVGSSLWNIVNWHATPSNIAISGAVVGTTAVNFSVQYTYDDPNNLPAGIQFPQPFNNPSIVNATSTVDGAINDPVTAVRLLVNSGTGTVCMTIIQAGISGP